MAIKWERLTVKSQEAVQAASGHAAENGNPEVLPLHLIAALLEDREGVVIPVLEKVGVPIEQLLGSTNGNLDLLWLRLSFLRKRNTQHARVVIGRDRVCIDRLRQSEAAHKATISSLDAMEVLFFFVDFELSLPLHGQGLILYMDVQVFLLDARDFEL